MTHHKVAVELEKRMKHVKRLLWEGGLTNTEMAASAAKELAVEFQDFAQNLNNDAVNARRIIEQLQRQTKREGVVSD
jgi:hypothetical protein